MIVQLERRAGVRRVSDIRFLPSARMDNLSESSRQTTFSPETVTLRVAAGAGPERS